MKKVAFMFVAAMAMSFAACTGNQKATNETADSLDQALDQAVEEVAQEVDSTAQAGVDSVAQAVQAAADSVQAQ